MKLYFRKAKIHGPWRWYWQVDGSSQVWYDYPYDATEGTLAWLRGSLR